MPDASLRRLALNSRGASSTVLPEPRVTGRGGSTRPDTGDGSSIAMILLLLLLRTPRKRCYPRHWQVARRRPQPILRPRCSRLWSPDRTGKSSEPPDRGSRELPASSRAPRLTSTCASAACNAASARSRTFAARRYDSCTTRLCATFCLHLAHHGGGSLVCIPRVFRVQTPGGSSYVFQSFSGLVRDSFGNL